MNETIVGISTALGVGAISIVRLSGDEAIDVVSKIFSLKTINKKPSHTISYGHIVDNGNIVDEVMVSIMRAPKTFTKEDVVEINCHGGIATTTRVYELCIINGARAAEPGEFTKRAFLNGRIDLLEAESIMDLINSKTEEARKISMNGVNGNASSLIKSLRGKIIKTIANISANIDYPEYEDIEEVTYKMIKDNCDVLESEIKKIVEEGQIGQLLKEGIKTAIIGKPNVGKSSILNLLLSEEKAIVTDIAGTTRDNVEGLLNIGGITLNLIDTAGIRKTEDKVEKIGVDKSLNLISSVELILFVLNNNEKLTSEDLEIMAKIEDKNHIIIINKIDLEEKIDLKNLKNPVFMSASTKIGVNELVARIKSLFELDKIKSSDFNFVTNANAIAILKRIQANVCEIKRGIDMNVPIDMIEIDLRKIWQELGEIIGETYEEEYLDNLFKMFCLGK
jgi:tRNA modification GTPase